MKEFMEQDFLLSNETAKTLYHEYAEDMPIYDYHCHLSAQEIAENKTYKNMTEIWLGGDHYKWRAMRSNGVTEDYITGQRSDKEKFMKYAALVPYTLGNPLFHWTHLELQRYFNIKKVLSPSTAQEIWESCNQQLATPEFSVRNLITRSNVNVICTTDDPCDALDYHKEIAEDLSFQVKVLPTYRPDKGYNIDKESFKPWIKALGTVVAYEITDTQSLIKALTERMTYFHSVGCRIADHGMDVIQYISPDMTVANGAFDKAIDGEALTYKEIATFKGTVLNALGKGYAKLGWAMQIHIGALRNNSKRMFETIGPDTGFDSVHDEIFAAELSQFLDDLDSTDELPKTILYALNPRDNYVIATMVGNFQGGGIAGKIQFGSGWWFCDQKEGMIEQLKALSSLGLLSRFVGMLTDSRSFLSYTRHEYFRRILCNLIGEWVENGEYPNDIEFLGQVVKDISYNNAVNYFEI